MQRVLTALLSLVVLLGCHGSLGAATDKYRGLIVSEDGQTHVYRDGDWESGDRLPVAPSGASLKVREGYLPDRFQPGHAGAWQVTLKYRGLYQADGNGRGWKAQAGLHERPVVFDKGATRRVMGFDQSGRFLLHKHAILYKTAEGYKRLKTDFSRVQYFTSVFSTNKKIYVGTSLNGLYVSKNYSQKTNLAKRKIVFKKRFSGLPYIPHNGSFYMFEELTALHETSDGSLYAGISIDSALYYKPRRSKRFKKVEWPAQLNGKSFDVNEITSNKAGKRLWVSTTPGLVEVVVRDGRHSTSFTPWAKLLSDRPDGGRVLFAIQDAAEPRLFAWNASKSYLTDPARQKRMKVAQSRRLFYSSAYNYKKRRRKVQAMLARDNYNGIVIDLKDDFGYIRYHSKVPFVKKVGAVRPMLKLEKLVAYAHEKNRYVVARMVVFKDPVLYRQKGFAILDKHTKRPWVGNPGEKWIDPFNPRLATDYYIPLLKEIQSLGVDEIQLDYIRFPSDGPTWRTYHRHRKIPGMYYSEAIANFLHQVSEAVDIPLGVDVYGYHGIYRASGVIGQDIDAFAPHVDVVSPMLYSSHFGPRYLTNRPRTERAYNLLRHCAKRYNYIAAGRYLVRPYLQAFPMQNRLWGYGKKYFLDQIKGGTDEGVTGYIFWGAFDHLRKVERAIKTLSAASAAKP